MCPPPHSRTLEVGRGLWRSSYSPSRPNSSRADCPRPDDFWVSTRNRGSTAAQGNPYQYLVILTVKKYLLILLYQNLAVFLFVPIFSCPVAGCHWKEPGYVIFTPFCLFICIGWDLPPAHPSPEPVLLQAEWSPTLPFLVWELLQSLIILVALCWALSCSSISHVLGSPELGTVLQLWPYQCWAEGKDHLCFRWSILRLQVCIFLQTVIFQVWTGFFPQISHQILWSY